MIKINFFPCRTKKFNNKIKNLQTKADQLKKELSDHNEEVTKSISEILEKRLTLKEHVETEDVAQKSSMEVAPITKEMIVCINSTCLSRLAYLLQIVRIELFNCFFFLLFFFLNSKEKIFNYFSLLLLRKKKLKESSTCYYYHN